MVADTNSSQHPRDRLIAAAMAMFHAHGYHSVGVQTLCEQAEVAKGSFYHFFESKEELTIAAVQEAWDRFKATVILPSMAMGGTAEERVRGIHRGCLDPSPHSEAEDELPHGCVFGRLAAGLTDGEPQLRVVLGRVFGEWAQLMATAADRDLRGGWAILADIQGRLVLSLAVDGASAAS